MHTVILFSYFSTKLLNDWPLLGSSSLNKNMISLQTKIATIKLAIIFPLYAKLLDRNKVLGWHKRLKEPAAALCRTRRVEIPNGDVHVCNGFDYSCCWPAAGWECWNQRPPSHTKEWNGTVSAQNEYVIQDHEREFKYDSPVGEIIELNGGLLWSER